MRAVLTVLAALVLPAAAATAAPPLTVLSAAPTQLTLLGAASGTIQLRNQGRTELAVSVTVVNFELDVSGRVEVNPRVSPGRAARNWLTVSPRRLVLQPAESARLSVTSHPAGNAEPGDHHALVIVAARPTGGGNVGVSTRIGVMAVCRG